MTAVVEKIGNLRRELRERRVGFVPTMGYLHEGHIELMRRAREDNDLVVVSIFVNPLQFAPNEDFRRYPRDLQGDVAKASEAGVDIVFSPSTDEMYPRGEIQTRISVGSLGEVGEGRYRPGHFDGVATVCAKLFGIVGPCRAYFGRKDAQQVAVVTQLTRDLDMPVEIVPCPTVREADGLAMSSRNSYLDERSRRAATVLSRSLFEAELLAIQGERSAGVLEGEVRATVTTEPLVELQYVETCDPETFERIDEVLGKAVIQLAAFVGGTRLIDNVHIEVGTGNPA